MSELPSQSMGAAPEAILEEQRQTFSQYVPDYMPDYMPDYIPDLPGGPPRIRGTEFGTNFGPDGQARSASVMMRKPVGSSAVGSPTVGSPTRVEGYHIYPNDGR